MSLTALVAFLFFALFQLSAAQSCPDVCRDSRSKVSGRCMSAGCRAVFGVCTRGNGARGWGCQRSSSPCVPRPPTVPFMGIPEDAEMQSAVISDGSRITRVVLFFDRNTNEPAGVRFASRTGMEQVGKNKRAVRLRLRRGEVITGAMVCRHSDSDEDSDEEDTHAEGSISKIMITTNMGRSREVGHDEPNCRTIVTSENEPIVGVSLSVDGDELFGISFFFANKCM